MRLDLHLHSTASDGALSPESVVRAARAGSLDVISLTDHDTAAGVADALAAAGTALTVIPGIEVSSTSGGSECHILGYFIDHTHPALERYSASAVERRKERMAGMIRRLEALGIHVRYEEVLEAAGQDVVALGRPHLARVLVDRGVVPTYAEAFNRYLGDGGPAFLPTELLTPREAIELIHTLGGIAVWAHPPWEMVERELDRFVGWGLAGLECYRPRYSTTDTQRFLHAAEAYELLVTGGSDWHGGWHGRLGDFAVKGEQVEEFLRQGGL